MIVLDGPMGTELNARGVDTTLPLWSARALIDAPEVVAAVHRAYADAGADLHTTNTFRTQRRTFGHGWQDATRLAARLARVGRVAGSVAPLEDCYRPDLSPPAEVAKAEHTAFAAVLAPEVDLLLCETFPHVGEALIAVDACLATGTETWVSFTAGPDGDLLTPAQVREGAEEAVRRGVSAVLVNCIPAVDTLRFVQALAGLGVPFGAYANAGSVDHQIGWTSAEEGPERYVELARTWRDTGATLLGSCCGTGPDHIRALKGLASDFS